jgi:hypothetical protein
MTFNLADESELSPTRDLPSQVLSDLGFLQ